MRHFPGNDHTAAPQTGEKTANFLSIVMLYNLNLKFELLDWSELADYERVLIEFQANSFRCVKFNEKSILKNWNVNV
jgi:hypothetical protein